MKIYKYKLEDITFTSDVSIEGIIRLGLYNVVKTARPHAYFLSTRDTISSAETEMSLIMHNMSAPYVALIKLYDSQLDNLIELKKETVSNTSDTLSSTEEQAAAIDTTLLKENDTPNGVNVNLTGDNYLSSVSRQELNAGKRERNILNDRLNEATTSYRDDPATLQIISNINTLVRNVNSEWLRLVDRELLSFELIEVEDD